MGLVILLCKLLLHLFLVAHNQIISENQNGSLIPSQQKLLNYTNLHLTFMQFDLNLNFLLMILAYL